MQDLQEVTQDVHYENFRTSRLAAAATDRYLQESTPLKTRCFFLEFQS